MAFDIEALLAAVQGPSEVGENLEYDPGFANLERALIGKPEQQIEAYEGTGDCQCH